MPDVDVAVVGAGPGGIAAALSAHGRGLETVVVDKATFPRDKTCGDGLTAGAIRAYRSLAFDPPALDGYGPVTETMLRSPSGRTVALGLPATKAYAGVVPRAELDAAFVTSARSRGVEVREGNGVVEVTPAADSVVLVLEDGGVVRSRYLVAADGHYSRVRRLVEAELRVDLGGWHAYRQYFAHVDDPRLWVLFERELLPGYAWVFPLPGGRANVGFGVHRSTGLHGRELARLWREVIASSSIREVLGPEAKAEGTPRAWPIPSNYDSSALGRGRIMFVGDAASVVDPMTGEGIAQALWSGALAAAAIATTDDPEMVATRYRRAVDRALGRDLRFAGSLGRILRLQLGARAAVRAAGLTSWTRRNFARWLFEDYPRALLLTPDRWKTARRGP